MTPSLPSERPSAKQLRVIRTLSQARGISATATRLNMSQSAVSRALSQAEAHMGVPLFQRGWSGTDPTPLGEIVVGASQRILDDLAAVETADLGGTGRLAGVVRWHQLEAVAAVTRTGSASGAARALGIRQPAVSQALRDLAGQLAVPLFDRRPAGLAPTPAAHALAALWDRVTAELDALPRLIGQAAQGVVGRVAVGMLPFSGQDDVLRTFGELTRDHPHVRLVAVPGSYTALCEALQRREIDLIIGILRGPSPVPGFIETPLYHEAFTIVARTDHPCHTGPLTVEAMARYRWLVGPHGTPPRRYFDRVLRRAGAPPPAQSCEIHGFANAEQMLLESDLLGLLCYGPAQLSALRPGLRRVALDLPGARVPIGVTRPDKEPPAPAVSAFLERLRRRVDPEGPLNRT